MHATPIKPLDPTPPSKHPPVQSGQIYFARADLYAKRGPFCCFFTVGMETRAGSGLFTYKGDRSGSAHNIAFAIKSGGCLLVQGYGAHQAGSLPPEVARLVDKYLEVYMASGYGFWEIDPSRDDLNCFIVRDLLSNSDICEAAKEALPEGAILVTEVLPGLGVTLWCDHPADKLAELEDQLRPRLAEGRKLTLYSAGMLCLSRLAGAVAEVVLSKAFKVDAQRRQVSSVIAEVRASGAPPWTVRAWTAALAVMFEPSDRHREAVLVEASALSMGMETLALLTKRLDRARNGLARPTLSVQAEVATRVMTESGIPVGGWRAAMVNRFMSVYAAG